MASDSLETLHDLFVHELRDLYSAENQLIKALPKMAQAAQSPELKRAFENHLRETKEQIRRLEQVFKGLGEKPTGKTCKAMKGLVEEGEELLEEDADPNVMDAALIVAAQKVEHYEIASYGSVCTFGRLLGLDEATEILKQTMAEEETTDRLLTSIAEQLNVEAEVGEAGGEGGESDAEEKSSDGQASGARGGSRMGANRMSSSGNRRSNAGGGSARGRSSSRNKTGGARDRSSGRSRSREAARSRR